MGAPLTPLRRGERVYKSPEVLHGVDGEDDLDRALGARIAKNALCQSNEFPRQFGVAGRRGGPQALRNRPVSSRSRGATVVATSLLCNVAVS